MQMFGAGGELKKGSLKTVYPIFRLLIHANKIIFDAASTPLSQTR